MKKSTNKKKAEDKRSAKIRELVEYDLQDTSGMIDVSRPLRFEDIGLRLPEIPPTQVISIRLPSQLLNELRALGSERDVPYQALIKLLLAESVANMKRGVKRKVAR